MNTMGMKLRLIWFACSALLLASCGGSGDGTPPGPKPAADGFAYVSNINDSNVSAYKLDAKTGVLTLIAGSPFAGVVSPTGLAMSPDSHFLAAGNINGPGISVFRVDTFSGAPALVAGSPFLTPGGGFPLQNLFHPSGKFLYAGMQVSSTSDVWAFSVDVSSGALTPIVGAPFHGQSSIGGGGVNSIAMHPSGKFLYASGSFQGITGYAVDSSSGLLAQLPGSPFITSVAFFNSKLVVHPSGNFLFMGDFDADGVRVFPISSDGSVGSEIAGSPFTSGAGPRDVALDPSGKFAFVPNEGDLNVAAFSINATSGAFTLVDRADTGNGPSSVVVDSTGKHLYVTNYWDGTVSAYTIDAASGALASVAGSPFVSQDGAISVVTTK